MKPKVIAFYLPQYHPTPDNDKWWGTGFTEWTNVGKAKPLFKGHYQPKVPADLGYYDLRLPEVREAQAELAKEAGLYGFCYYHYWFGNGKEELELPFDEVLRLGKPDFPFMLCWANESWHKKFWNKDGKGSSKEMLIEQTYPGVEDHIAHFYRLLPAFKDSRYIKIDGKPLFMIYNPEQLSDFNALKKIWDDLALKNGLPGISYWCQMRLDLSVITLRKLKAEGYDFINTMRLWEGFDYGTPKIVRIVKRLFRAIFNLPYIRPYNKVIDALKFLISKKDIDNYLIPTIIPNWDHTPRSKNNGAVIRNSTPELFKKHARDLLSFAKANNKEFVLLKSWNEWGEGNYLEPDLKYGKRFIEALSQTINEI